MQRHRIILAVANGNDKNKEEEIKSSHLDQIYEKIKFYCFAFEGYIVFTITIF